MVKQMEYKVEERPGKLKVCKDCGNWDDETGKCCDPEIDFEVCVGNQEYGPRYDK